MKNYFGTAGVLYVQMAVGQGTLRYMERKTNKRSSNVQYGVREVLGWVCFVMASLRYQAAGIANSSLHEGSRGYGRLASQPRPIKLAFFTVHLIFAWCKGHEQRGGRGEVLAGVPFYFVF
jgi:hypothetical protein